MTNVLALRVYKSCRGLRQSSMEAQYIKEGNINVSFNHILIFIAEFDFIPLVN